MVKRIKDLVWKFRSKCIYCGQPGNLFGYSDYHLSCWFERVYGENRD